MESNFQPGVYAPTKLESLPVVWFAFQGDDLVILDNGQEIMLPQVEDLNSLNIPVEYQLYLGELHGQPCYAARVPKETELPRAYNATNIRWLLGRFDELTFQVAGRAKQILDWADTHRYCGRCSTPMSDHDTERAKVCGQCGLTQYPRISPCIICLVTRGHEVLLGRSPNFPTGLYSTLAGFIETGESIEEAVHREVLEEVGLKIKNLKYYGSQSWPFPNSLMIGFHAEHDSGEIQVDGKEIVDARWWDIKALPPLPPKESIAHMLIDSYIEAN